MLCGAGTCTLRCARLDPERHDTKKEDGGLDGTPRGRLSRTWRERVKKFRAARGCRARCGDPLARQTAHACVSRGVPACADPWVPQLSAPPTDGPVQYGRHAGREAPASLSRRGACSRAGHWSGHPALCCACYPSAAVCFLWRCRLCQHTQPHPLGPRVCCPTSCLGGARPWVLLVIFVGFSWYSSGGPRAPPLVRVVQVFKRRPLGPMSPLPAHRLPPSP